MSAEQDKRRGRDGAVNGGAPSGSGAAEAAAKEASKAADRALVEELLEALEPLEARARAMFGAWTVYLDDKPLGIVGDGGVYIKRSSADRLLARLTRPASPYPGAKEHWLLPPKLLRESPDDVRELLSAVAAALPARPKRGL